MTDDLPGWAQGKDDEELAAAVRAMVEMIRAREERKILAGLEQSLPDTPSYTWPPAPATAHLAFERDAAFVRQLIRRGEHTILLPKPQPLRYVFDPNPDPTATGFDHLTLTVHRCAAPAPYVGDPYCITWKVAVDDANRWVAGEPETQQLRDHKEPR